MPVPHRPRLHQQQPIGIIFPPSARQSIIPETDALQHRITQREGANTLPQIFPVCPPTASATSNGVDLSARRRSADRTTIHRQQRKITLPPYQIPAQTAVAIQIRRELKVPIIVTLINPAHAQTATPSDSCPTPVTRLPHSLYRSTQPHGRTPESQAPHEGSDDHDHSPVCYGAENMVPPLPERPGTLIAVANQHY